MLRPAITHYSLVQAALQGWSSMGPVYYNGYSLFQASRSLRGVGSTPRREAEPEASPDFRIPELGSESDGGKME